MSGGGARFGPVLYRAYPIGALGLMDDGRGLSRAFLRREGACPDAPEGETPLTAQAAQELDEYFAGRRKTFTVPLSPHGTPFQLAVWEALRAIPYGQTRTYGEIAAAVGMANHDNPLLIFTPCHRVVGKNRSLTGFACGLEVKRRLLGGRAWTRFGKNYKTGGRGRMKIRPRPSKSFRL